MKEAEIPDKLFYKIGEVAVIASLKPSVLRFWETEFVTLQPQKSKTGQRLYSRKEVELVLEIKRLLYLEKLTIDGAKRRLAGRDRRTAYHSGDGDGVEDIYAVLLDVRADLEKFRNSL